MCGIAGIFTYGNDPNPGMVAEVVAIRDAMAPRGPDGVGKWLSADARTAFAHRRLAIIDLRDEALQPMVAPEHGLTIVFNGEIYNYKALREGLISNGYRFRTESDTEVLLHLYAAYGAEMCNQLRGMYAFAICHEPSGTVFLARDPFGIKPLYYSDDGKTLRFASQVKALLAGGSVDITPDAAGHVGYYLWGSVPEPYTLFRGIRALEPGSTLQFDRGGRRNAQVFCSIPDILRSAERQSVAPQAEGARREMLHDALLSSVRHHLVSDVPVAVFLSAGIDSQCITALARETGDADLRTVTMAFREYKGTLKDEAPLAEACARRYATRHTTATVTGRDFQAELESFVRSMDQPTVDGLNTYFVSKAAADLGIKVCLSGLGGDEMFGGYSTFSQIPRLVRVAKTVMPFAAGGQTLRRLSSPWIGRYLSPKYAGVFEYGRTIPGAYLLHRGLFMPWELPRLLPPEMIREGWGQLEPMARLQQSVNGLHNDSLGVASLEMCHYMRNQLLRDADWAGMAHSVEIRVPFVDVQLLRDLAPYLHGVHAIRKPFVASTCGLDLAERPKTGFSIPVREWFGTQAETEGSPDPGITERGLRGWARYALARIYGPKLAMVAQ
jgi:asparagine synthase (glutamine-hydrolysing)